MCVQYIGGCSVHWRVFSTSGGVQYIGGISRVHRGGYHEYIGGDITSTSGISWCMWGSKLIKAFQFLLKTPMYWTSPDALMIFPRCTRDIPQCIHDMPPMYWTSPDVLMISPRCTNGIPPMYSWYPGDVLNTPRCSEHTLYRVKNYTETNSRLWND